jgi:LemA protein
MIALWIGVGVAVLVLLVAGGMLVGIHNRLVKLRNRFQNAFSQIDVQLKRRHDLIPNLVETAKSYMEHERETLEGVTQARNQAQQAEQQAAARPGDPQATQQLGQAEGGLSTALGRLFAVAEDYPDLKANENMKQLSEELTTTENKISFARQAYNDAVQAYKNARERFPNVLFANLFGFGDAEFFEIEAPSEREAPEVSFS